MGGWPVWLASASLRDRHGKIRPAKDWDTATLGEVLWAKNVPESVGCEPCHNPGRTRISAGLWLPEDCGQCPPCLARASVRTRTSAEIRRPW